MENKNVKLVELKLKTKPLLALGRQLKTKYVMENEEQLEGSICDTCTAGMCDICSERHTSSSYQSNQEEAGEYYSNLEKENHGMNQLRKNLS